MRDERPIDKEAVRAALQSARLRGAKTSVMAIYNEELPRLFGKKGQWSQVAGWVKEIKKEEGVVAATDQLSSAPSEPLPEAVAVALESAAVAMSDSFTSLAASLGHVLTAFKAEQRREQEIVATGIRADADKRVAEAEGDVQDAIIVASQFEGELESEREKANKLAAELAMAKESLAAEKARAEELAKNASSARQEAKAERERAELAAKEVGEAKAESARLAAELKSAIAAGRKDGKNA